MDQTAGRVRLLSSNGNYCTRRGRYMAYLVRYTHGVFIYRYGYRTLMKNVTDSYMAISCPSRIRKANSMYLDKSVSVFILCVSRS